MTQHDVHSKHSRSAIISELACIQGEISELQSRVSRLIRDLSTTTVISRTPLSATEIERLKRVMETKGPILEFADLDLFSAEREALATANADEEANEAGAYPRETEETAEICRACLSYDPATGILTWMNPRSPRVKKGDKAGCVSAGRGGKSYILVRIDGKNFSAHRIAWLLFYGHWPQHEVLHDNLNGEDNRIINLVGGDRFDVTQNNSLRHDNTSGTPGVRLDEASSQNKPWRAKITRDGQTHSLGIHATREEAVAARLEAEREYHGHQIATGTQGESAASADTASAPDANKTKRKAAAKPADPIAGSAADPVVPRRPSAVQAEGGGLVQDGGSTGETRGDQVLNLWAETTLTQDEIARKLKVKSGTPAAYLSTARRLADPRALKGDLARAALRPPRHEIPDGRPALINLDTGQITGAAGSWTADRAVAKAINVLADGQLYDTNRMAKVSGIKEDAIVASMGIWASALAKIGVELRYQRGYGCRLLAIQSEAA